MRAELAMLVLVSLALGSAFLANAGAQLQHLAQHLLVRAGPSYRKLARCLAYVRAVEAGADALRHVHCLGRARVGAAEAHARAIHQMVSGIAERLVDVPGDVRMKRDHLADGHDLKAPENPVENRPALSLFRL